MPIFCVRSRQVYGETRLFGNSRHGTPRESKLQSLASVHFGNVARLATTYTGGAVLPRQSLWSGTEFHSVRLKRQIITVTFLRMYLSTPCLGAAFVWRARMVRRTLRPASECPRLEYSSPIICQCTCILTGVQLRPLQAFVLWLIYFVLPS